ncbi:hypothetical protein BDY19DRAFT_996926 [Irpex rosettiformis]|uniref:Uncharacterized protein n=1 Tax=Irpex rosettiformis TaxID=378272 RepID=A0ACB8TTQ6_9APHY|nr:hypothetical protein BDY19DRAFT_996926 [Irpex rosettiformis]
MLPRLRPTLLSPVWARRLAGSSRSTRSASEELPPQLNDPDSVWKVSRKRKQPDPPPVIEEPELLEEQEPIDEADISAEIEKSLYVTPQQTPSRPERSARQDQGTAQKRIEIIRQFVSNLGSPDKSSISKPTFSAPPSSIPLPPAHFRALPDLQPFSISRFPIPSTQIATRLAATSAFTVPSVSSAPAAPMAQNAVSMPLSGDRHAPQFDPSQPRTLAL